MSDKRDIIIQLFQNEYDGKIGTKYYIPTNIKNVPIVKAEEAYEKTLPLVVLSNASTSFDVADIGGKKLFCSHLIDCNVYIQRTEVYDWEELINEVCDNLIYEIYENINAFGNCIIGVLNVRNLTGLEKNEVERRLIEIEIIEINEVS
ncbi:MAG: hypothetical protein H5T45_01490 [Thermoplasmatales archaeon]|nr:hypothetical protein [Thermoplasmatales archaeon]